MNFVNWFAWLLIDAFGLDSEMARGLSVYAGMIMLFVSVFTIAVTIVYVGTKLGFFKKSVDNCSNL